MNYEDVELQDFINHVFQNNIKSPNSIPITFYDPSNPNISLKDLFTIFSIILTEGMKIKFGTRINLNNLNHNDFNMIINYFKSFSVTFIPIKIRLNEDKTVNTHDVQHFNENDFNKVFPKTYNTCQELTNLVEELIILGHTQEEKLTDYHLHIKTDTHLYRFLFNV